MRLPAITRAARAQRSADILARGILAADTPEQAQRFRGAYQYAAARAARLDNPEPSDGYRPFGYRETASWLLGRARTWLADNWGQLLLMVVVVAVVGTVWDAVAPAWLQTDARLVVLGVLVGLLVSFAVDRRAERRAEIDDLVYEESTDE